jgi:hypothetical protein
MVRVLSLSVVDHGLISCVMVRVLFLSGRSLVHRWCNG